MISLGKDKMVIDSLAWSMMLRFFFALSSSFSNAFRLRFFLSS